MDHLQEAASMLARRTTNGPEHASYLVAKAQAHALIAIAQELRTANLIAIGSPVAMPCMDADKALSDAYRRLGLDDGAA